MSELHRTCTNCGRELSNIVSMRIGLGPICRVNLKNNAVKEKKQYEQMMFNQPEFDYEFDHKNRILSIEDLNAGASVTTYLDKVLRQIAKENPDIKMSEYKKMYRDSMGVWDGIAVVRGVATFFAITETEQWVAKEKLLNHTFQT